MTNIVTLETKLDKQLKFVKAKIVDANDRVAAAAEIHREQDATEQILKCSDYDSLCEHFLEVEPTYAMPLESNSDVFITAAYRVSNSCKTIEQLAKVRAHLHSILDQAIDFNLSQSDNTELQDAYSAEEDRLWDVAHPTSV